MKGFLELKRELFLRMTAGCCARRDDESSSILWNLALEILDLLRMSGSPDVLMGAEMDLLVLLSQGGGSPGDQLQARSIASTGCQFTELFSKARHRHLALRWQRELVVHALVGPPEAVRPRLLPLLEADDEALLHELTGASQDADPPEVQGAPRDPRHLRADDEALLHELTGASQDADPPEVQGAPRDPRHLRADDEVSLLELATASQDAKAAEPSGVPRTPDLMRASGA